MIVSSAGSPRGILVVVGDCIIDYAITTPMKGKVMHERIAKGSNAQKTVFAIWDKLCLSAIEDVTSAKQAEELSHHIPYGGKSESALYIKWSSVCKSSEQTLILHRWAVSRCEFRV